MLDRGGAPQNSLRAGALRSNNRSKSDHEGVCPSAHARPRPALLGTHRREPGPKNHTGHRCARPAWRRRCAPRNAGPSAAMARVLSTPFWLRLRRGVCGVGMRVEARMLRQLTRRGCPNGARKRAVSSTAHPASAPTQVCPFAPRRGRRLQGRLSFGYFSLAKQRKVPRPPGRDPASRPQQSHSKSYQNNSYQRLPNKRKSPKTLNISTERNTSSAQPPAPGAGCGCPAPGAAESAAARSPPSPGHRPAPCGGPAPSH
jgi:hypothetical protein